jgi:hypothetical protein
LTDICLGAALLHGAQELSTEDRGPGASTHRCAANVSRPTWNTTSAPFFVLRRSPTVQVGRGHGHEGGQSDRLLGKELVEYDDVAVDREGAMLADIVVQGVHVE